MTKLLPILFMSLSVLLISCSKLVTVTFEREAPEIVPTDKGLYGKVKTFSVKTSNQYTMFSPHQLSAPVNVVINSIEKYLVTQGLTQRDEGADIAIEIISIDKRQYATNQATKKDNRKPIVFPDCNFEFDGYSAFVKVKRGEKSVNYTFYSTPCTGGCTFKIGKDCKQSSPTKVNPNVPYVLMASETSLNEEVLGHEIGTFIVERIKESH